MDGAGDLGGQHILIRVAQGHRRHIGPHRVAGDAAVDGGIGHPVAAQPVRAMGATGILARHVKPLQRGAGVHIHDDAAHEVMRGRHHLDQARRQIKATVCAAFDHALEFPAHSVGAQMRHRDEHAFLLGIVVLAHLGIYAAADHIAGGAFALSVVVEHEPLARMADQMAAGTAQPFLQHGSGHSGVITRQQARGVKLHHFHVAQRKARAQGHGQPVHRLVAGRRVILIHGWATAGGHQHGFGAHEPKPARAHIDHQNARQGRSVACRNQTYGAMFLQSFDGARQHLFHQAVDDFDTGQVALVNGPVRGLAGKGLVVQCAVGVAVEKTADFVFQLLHPHHGLFAQPPGHILIGQPLATFDRIHEMPLDRVAMAQRDIIAALHHAGTAAFSDQPLDRDGDLRAGRG